jgi:predicted  nucleic acid-binding Zn-ribbon protein
MYEVNSSEVEDLEDEVAGLSTRSDKLKSELEVIEDLIKGKRMQLTSTKRLIKSIQNNRKLYVTIENLTL